MSTWANRILFPSSLVLLLLALVLQLRYATVGDQRSAAGSEASECLSKASQVQGQSRPNSGAMN